MNESGRRAHVSGMDEQAVQRLLTLAGCENAVVVEFDGDSRYLNVWTDDVSILRIDPVASMGKTLVEVLGETAGRPLAAIVRRVFETGQREQTEWSVMVRGAKRWIQGDFKRVVNGDVFTVVGIARDISERKESEDRLRKLEERYRLAGLATNDLLYDWDMVTHVTTWGRNVRSFLGLEEHEMTGAVWLSRMAPEDVPRVQNEIRRVLKSSESTRTHRYRVRRGDGSWAELLDRCLIVRGNDGRATRMVGSLTDVTEVHRLQAQLLQADRLAAIGALAAGVGHEINNPLSYVLGNIEYALEVAPVAESEDARTALEEAREGATRIAGIVRGLRQFSDTDPVEVREVQIERVLERSLKMADNQIRHRARLVRDFSAVPMVSVNEAKLEQVCLNLLINAAHRIADGKQEQNEVRIATRVEGAHSRVIIAVSDTGAGIPPEHLGRVFDPFFTTTHVGENAGIGLAVCRSIVQSMGGEISVTSIPGERTTFEIALPAVVVAPEPARPRMLVIDDDLAVGRYIARALSKDCDVTAVGSSSCALALLDAGHTFDVVLCDMMMPEMNGVELYEVLRERHAEVLPRMFFMTGGAFTPETERFLEAMADRTLQKPIAKEQLRALLTLDQAKDVCRQSCTADATSVPALV